LNYILHNYCSYYLRLTFTTPLTGNWIRKSSNVCQLKVKKIVISWYYIQLHKIIKCLFYKTKHVHTSYPHSHAKQIYRSDLIRVITFRACLQYKYVSTFGKLYNRAKHFLSFVCRKFDRKNLWYTCRSSFDNFVGKIFCTQDVLSATQVKAIVNHVLTL